MIISTLAWRWFMVGMGLLGLSVALCGVVVAQDEEDPVPGTGEPEKPKEVPAEDKAAIAALAAYRKWRLVNPQPHWVPGPLASSCAPFRLRPKDGPHVPHHVPHNVHQDKWVRVYVNAPGENAMMTEKTPAFPVDTLIVKEKLAEKNSETPELLTVMAKRAPGYDAKNGDWEYLVFNGTGEKIRARGQLDNCMACHIAQKPNGYVFRDYLPEAVKTNLK